MNKYIKSDLKKHTNQQHMLGKDCFSDIYMGNEKHEVSIMKRALSVCIVFIMMFSTIVYAGIDAVNIDNSSKKVSIRGTFEVPQGVDVMAEVSDGEGNTVFAGVEKTDAGGEFRFRFILPQTNSVYMARIKSNLADQIIQKEIVLVEADVKSEAEQALIQADASTVGSVLVSKIGKVAVYQALGLDMAQYTTIIDKTDVNNALADITEPSRISEIYDKACTLSLINQTSVGKLALLESKVSALGLDQSEGYVAYNQPEIGDKAKESMIDQLIFKYGEEVTDFNEWVANLILNKVNYTKLFEMVAYMPQTFEASELPDFEDEGVTPEAVAKIVLQSGVSLENFHSMVRTAVSKVKKQSSDNTPGYSSGGGSGGGSGSRGSIPLYTSVLPPQLEDSVGLVFPDMIGFDWAIEHVEKLYKIGIVKGDLVGNFRPADNISREEFVALVMRALGKELTENDVLFTDCVDKEWYMPYVATAYKSGFIQGISEDKFGIGQNITREDMAVILHRVSVASGVTFKTKHRLFADSQEISEYAQEAVGVLGRAGIINGTPEGKFNPADFATRAEAAKMISAIYDKLQDAIGYEE